ncbi:MAG: NADP-dependent malic enzyme [Acidobacteria bacterium]|nr:NADP-dependent malic enzyme [Acidobacteriota bacterium]
MIAVTKEEVLAYHQGTYPGKIEVLSTKPCRTQRELSLAYTPGVAVPCLEIQKDPDAAYRYTDKGNLVAVLSNGSAVLGLGDMGALAAKPVMEGKAVLFKRFAGIDVFDIEINTHDADEVIRTCQVLEPTFGGINLEDIKSPECFYIEQELQRTMRIPVFHDDQHGTAIISGAALLNALELVRKGIADIRIVFCGAGAAGLACAAHYVRLGVRQENIILCDVHGVVYQGREEGMNPFLEKFAAATPLRTLRQAMKDADVFVGLSVKGAVDQDMVRSMAARPIIFAMANPDPEISYEEATAVRPDAIVATGRSDYPNQVNNILGFPFIFRGALDVRARAINDAMKLAATFALAALAKEDVPDSVCRAYGVDRLRFGPAYIIPKPFDPRVLVWEAYAVADAAMKSGAAQKPVDLDTYREKLEQRIGRVHGTMRAIIRGAQRTSKRVVFPEGEEERIIRAARILVDESIAAPILIGRKSKIMRAAEELGIGSDGIAIVDQALLTGEERYAQELFGLRMRKGVTIVEARELVKNRTILGALMVRFGEADALVAGLTQHYPATIRPALQVIGVQTGRNKVCSCYFMVTRDGRKYVLADATVNIMPSAADLAEIALSAAGIAQRFGLAPKIAMLSFSNFGSSRHALCDKVQQATELVRKADAALIVDGEMQADTAVVPEIADRYGFSAIKGDANVLVFPDLQSANIAYKLLMRLGDAEAIGPILVGMKKPVHVLQTGATVEDVVNMAAMAAVEAQQEES